jgi:peptidoglycan hydrolase-like protein with peptidoglycan-binding domain
VERLQKSLGLEVTGKFDRRVVNAVRRFQSGIGATPTGRVDSAPWRARGI